LIGHRRPPLRNGRRLITRAYLPDAAPHFRKIQLSPQGQRTALCGTLRPTVARRGIHETTRVHHAAQRHVGVPVLGGRAAAGGHRERPRFNRGAIVVGWHPGADEILFSESHAGPPCISTKERRSKANGTYSAKFAWTRILRSKRTSPRAPIAAFACRRARRVSGDDNGNHDSLPGTTVSLSCQSDRRRAEPSGPAR
jgi:hypothetical protein